MKCLQCGFENDEPAEICRRCGTDIETVGEVGRDDSSFPVPTTGRQNGDASIPSREPDFERAMESIKESLDEIEGPRLAEEDSGISPSLKGEVGPKKGGFLIRLAAFAIAVIALCCHAMTLPIQALNTHLARRYRLR